MNTDLREVLTFLNLHHQSFFAVEPYAKATKQPTPTDTRAWSQILASLLTGIEGYGRKKGPDLLDGSDVKGANTWGAIDTPRFNGVIKAGTKSEYSGNLSYLDTMPKLIFVLWDNEPKHKSERCRVWLVRPPKDPFFRKMCAVWYKKRDEGIITSNNFQLHPPRGKNSNEFRNSCGNLHYPLFLEAIWNSNKLSYDIVYFKKSVLTRGMCLEAV